MDTGDSIDVVSAKGSKKTVTVVSVTRGRAVVRWAHIGEFDVDLATGELIRPPEPLGGVYSVDLETGRVQGSRSHVAPEDMLMLALGATVRLTSGVTAEVIDYLASEGVLKIFVHGPKGSGVWRGWHTGYRVVGVALARLRERAGVKQAS